MTQTISGALTLFHRAAGIIFADSTIQATTASGDGATIGSAETPPGGFINRVHFGAIDLLAGAGYPDGSIYGGPGFAAPLGSLYIQYDSSDPKFAIWQKTGGGDKDWTILCDSGI